LFDEHGIVVTGVEVLVGDMVVDPWGIGSVWSQGLWDGGGAVWSFPSLLCLIDRIIWMWERELGHDELRQVCPRPLSSFI
jgi:hypothetical protein